MLTDIFARRYENRPLFDTVGPREQALFVQAYRIINEQLFPYYGYDKKVDERAKATWTSLHDQLTMELGIKELSSRFYSYQGEWMGKPHTYSGWYEMNAVCEKWITHKFSDDQDPDVFVKRRLSFVELAFRQREQQITYINSQLDGKLRTAALQDAAPKRNTGLRIPGIFQSNVDRVKQNNIYNNTMFQGYVHELNERFRQAGMPLHYHNGYIQITTDSLTQAQIEQPFWDAVKDQKWVNVSTDMATAIDGRDTGGRDPAFYAGKALESTIKIISNEKNWTTGKEKGASDYLNHLESKANGRFIDSWERHILQAFFNGVRNDYGHGPGSDPMPTMTAPQIDQAIEFCMSWIKSLIKRL
jgi:AbiJ N-terminal domain 4